jgi:hypothetical protein
MLLDGTIRGIARFDGSYERYCQRLGQCIYHVEPEWTIDLGFKAPKVIGDAVRLGDHHTVLGVLVPLQSKFMTLDLLQVVAGKVVKDHGFSSFDLVLRPLGTSGVSCRLLLAVFGTFSMTLRNLPIRSIFTSMA